MGPMAGAERGNAASTDATTPQPAAQIPVQTPAQTPAQIPVQRRPDESMSLMRELVSHALDDGYASAAARRDPNKPKKRRRVPVFVVALILFGLLITVAAIQTRQSAPAVAKEKAELVQRIEAETTRVDDLRARAERLQREITRMRDDGLETSAGGQQLRERLIALETLTGTGRVTGPGLRITVDDAPIDEVSGGEATSDNRILDLDLQYLVNGLWSAGAEAIAINGERLTALTAIRGADISITVDYRPLARPYVVEAIGDPATLEARFAESPGGEWLYDLKAVQHIRFETQAKDELTLPADSGTQLRYARTEGPR